MTDHLESHAKGVARASAPTTPDPELVTLAREALELTQRWLEDGSMKTIDLINFSTSALPRLAEAVIELEQHPLIARETTHTEAIVRTASPCETCQGRGRYGDRECGDCLGTGEEWLFADNASDELDPELCAMCGKPAAGFTLVNDERLCHGDDDPTPTCYEKAQTTAMGVERASAHTTPDPEADEWEICSRESEAERDAYKAAWAELESWIGDLVQVAGFVLENQMAIIAAKYGLETKP